MASSLRRRRPASTAESGGSRDASCVRATSSASRDDFRLGRRALDYRRFFALLFLPRAVSAAINLVHDCDETFNFWEPLHYLVYGHGLQTWEHSPEHALRSYLYLGLHYAVAKPVALLAGDARGKLLVFTLVRLALGVASAASEAWLCAETAALSPVAGGVLAALLAGSAGMFAASTAFLPSAFAMYLLTLAAAATLAGRHRVSCAACVLAVVWGWPFAGLAALPHGVAAIRARGFLRAAEFVLVPLVVSLLLAAAVDTHFYGRPTLSTLNILRYNVVAGGGSELYGVEPATFYARNLLNAFNVAVVASALAVPLAATVPGATGANLRRLLVAHAPFPMFFAFFSLVPHKEERFMYAVYPSLCVGAGVAAAAAAETARRLGRVVGVERTAARVATACVWGATAVSVALGASRVAALVHGYGAPMTAYASLPSTNVVSEGVCVGAEWHRFPSSFHLPSPAYRLRFLRSGFDGALPMPFDRAAGGTRHAPPGLNDRNEADPRQWAAEPWDGECGWVVDLVAEGSTPAVDPTRVVAPGGRNVDGGNADADEGARRADEAAADSGRETSEEDEEEVGASAPSDAWVATRTFPFLDQANSPALSRAFYVPGWSAAKNAYGKYVVYQRAEKEGDGDERVERR